MAFDLSFFVILFGGVLVLLVVLGTWVLWKPLLALVPAPPDAVRRDLAYRIRGIGYPVELVKDVLRVRVDSLPQVKLHVRRGARGTQIRYEVDATNLGWSIVLVTALITYLACIAVRVVVLLGFALAVPLQLPNPPLSLAVLASFGSGLTVVLGSWLVYLRRSPKIRELEEDASFSRTAWMRQTPPGSATGERRAGLEMLLRAATRSPVWREVRASRRFWHDPIAGLAMFILGYGAIFLPFLAILGAGLPWEWRAFLAALGTAFAAGEIWFVRHWIRDIQSQDDRDRRSWEQRRAAIEAELWRILSG